MFQREKIHDKNISIIFNYFNKIFFKSFFQKSLNYFLRILLKWINRGEVFLCHNFWEKQKYKEGDDFPSYC